MKKIVLLIAAQFAFLLAFSVSISPQLKADKIVLERMSQENRLYTIYAKEDLQTGMTITTSAGEVLELDYHCWVYYVIYADVNCCAGRYLIVHGGNENLLEVNANGKAAAPKDLAEWRRVGNVEPVSIIGKWKLVIATTVPHPIPTAYNCSQCNIVYDFKINDVLTISGDNIISGDDGTIIFCMCAGLAHAIGEHNYLIEDDNPQTGVHGLAIDDMTCQYYISSKKMTITLADGSSLYFEKIEPEDNFACDQNVIISADEYENAPNHPISVIDMKIEGNCLKVKFGTSGCSENNWIVKLIDRGAVMMFDQEVPGLIPPQRTLRLSLNDIGDCDAYFEKEISFNIKDLQVSGTNKVWLDISGNGILYEYDNENEKVFNIPACIESKIQEIKSEKIWNPPAKIWQCLYNGQNVYFIPQRCCDIPSILLDENCNTLCRPDGGDSGGGDGRCEDFFDTLTDLKLIWEDER